jgi:hypothetical protein
MKVRPIELKEIEKYASNIYEAIRVMGLRSRNINDELKLEFKSRIENISKKGIDDDSEDFHNPEVVRIALEFEKRKKPHLLSLEEFLKGNIKFRYKSL